MSILLVHGAWHGAWCWTPLLQCFEERGIDARALDLPGHGSQRALASGVRLADYADAVNQAAAAMRKPPLVVGHSMGGIVISEAAEKNPEGFRSLVYVAAFLPVSGQTLVELSAMCGGNKGEIVNNLSVLGREEAVDLFYGDCDAALAEWALDHLQPQPLSPALDPVSLTPARFGKVARDYVLCRDDRAIPANFQDAMARGSGCRRISELSCGHSPFFACPETLADVLVESLQSNPAGYETGPAA
jgi:pimeloyl-ACP methyl ester carboxylesterase